MVAYSHIILETVSISYLVTTGSNTNLDLGGGYNDALI